VQFHIVLVTTAVELGLNISTVLHTYASLRTINW